MTENMRQLQIRLNGPLTQSLLKEILEYDPKTGKFTWLRRVHSRAAPGGEAGSLSVSGYIRIQIGGIGRIYLAHRLAFLWMLGDWPEFQVDHMDGIRHNNAWENLRDVPQTINMQNQTKPHKQNTTGYIGVGWHKAAQKYKAVLNKKGLKKKWLGLFDTIEEASAAYHKAKAEHCEGYIPPKGTENAK